MAVITGKPNLFFVTSPRSPYKMKDEIQLLIEKHEGKVWDNQTQTAFTKDLSETGFFEGTSGNNAAFKARDRINRGPKALGFVDLSPVIKLTGPGRAYLYGRRPHEAFTRQLLKFQFSSPYHIDKEGSFAVKPYLELLRLVYELDTLSKDEIALFAIQLIHCSEALVETMHFQCKTLVATQVCGGGKIRCYAYQSPRQSHRDPLDRSHRVGHEISLSRAKGRSAKTVSSPAHTNL